MLATIPEHGLTRSARLLLKQFRQCGYMYASRKYLAVTLLFQHSAHLAVTHSLALPQTHSLVIHHPKSAFKYIRKYLARSFGIHARAVILANHYHFLNKRVRPDFIGMICRGKIMLWESEAGGNQYAISLTYPKNEEGELFLVFSENGMAIFTLAFTITPGKMLALADEQIIFIGRLQGLPGGKEAIKRASGSFQDVTPATLLLDATRAIATSLNITGIVGVSAQNQVCLCNTGRRTSTSTYDDFWVAAGASAIGELGYYLPTVAEEKPLSEIKNNHRSRVKRKRQFRNALAKQVSLSFDSKCIAHRTYSGSYPCYHSEDYCGTLAAM